MAIQIILNKRRKAKEAKELGKEPQKVAFTNPAFQPSQAKPKERKQKARFTNVLEGSEYGKVGLEDGMSVVDEHDRTVVKRLYEVVKETKSRKTNYCNLFAFLVFTALYCTVLYLQFNVAELYKLVTSQQGLLPDVTTFNNANDVYDYIDSTFIKKVWADPVCGDGVCDRPVEFSGFGRFGCAIDCGLMDTQAVSFQFTTTFASPADRQNSNWNVCEIEPYRICWFKENQLFEGQVGFFETTLALPNGTWELRITAPNGGVSGVATVSLSGASTETYVQETLTRFGSCLPEDQSALTSCRRQCAVNAKCIIDACGNITPARLTDVLVDCFTLCNANFTSMQPYKNLNCVQVGQLANSSDDNVSFLATTNRKCILNPAYLTANPSQADSLAPKTAAPRANPLNSSGLSITTVPPGRRRLSQLPTNPYLPNGNVTTLYWNQFGTSDQQRFANLATAVARSIDTWTVDTCLAKYTISSSRQGPRMSNFFCAYFGGPPTLPGCSILDRTTNTTLNSTNPAGLQAFLARRYGPGNTGNYSISAQEQDTFIAILLNALDSVIATGLDTDIYLATEDRLHESDSAVVVDTGNKCNRAKLDLEWKLNVHYSTNLSVGDSIQFLWADNLPHALRGERLDDLQDVFRGVGANRRFVARGSICAPQNIGDHENGSFAGDPTPCVLSRTRAGGRVPVGDSFTYTVVFRTPGIYPYRDANYGNLMTGVVYVAPRSGTAPTSATLPQEDLECSPGCPVRLLKNGRCDTDFNCLTSECSFDGGDCSCPDPATVLSSANTVPIDSNNFCQCPVGQIKGPTEACCEAEFIGVNKKHPFDVLVQSTSESIAAPAEYNRLRFSTNHNRVLGGLLIHQTRLKSAPCSSKRFRNLFQSCGKGTSLLSYGVDPVFVPASPLYNIDVLPRVGQFYAPNELNARGTPRGFFPTDVTGFQAGFPIVIDVNLDQGGASDRLQYLKDGLYLDNATETLTLRLPTYNGFDNKFVFFEVRMSFLAAGKISIKSSVFAIDLQAYLNPKAYARGALEILLCIGILFGVYTELREAIETRIRTGSFLNHFRVFWNWIDGFSIALLLTAMVLRITYVFGVFPGFKARVSYDIYEDLNSEARFFQLKRNGSELDDLAHMLSELEGFTTERAAYISLNGINIFLMILRILKLLNFQPRMGILTRTLAEAGPDLLNFFVLWGLIFVGYSFMGHIIVGSSVEYFRTLGYSMATCFSIILGDTQAQYNFLALDGWQFWAAQLFFWSFNIFMVMVVMNFLVAIAVDAFADVKERTETAPTILEELAEFSKYELERPFKRMLSDGKVMKQLKGWGGKKRKIAEDAGQGEHPGVESTGEDGELSERLVLTLDGQHLDMDALQEIFERRQMQANNVASHDPQRVAKQLLAMYGKHTAQMAMKRKKSLKKNKDLIEVKSGMSKMERRIIESESRIEGMCTTIIGALVKSGMLSEADVYDAEASRGSLAEMEDEDDFGTKE